MRNTSGQLTNRLHFLALHELVFEHFPRANIDEISIALRRVLRIMNNIDGYWEAVFIVIL